MDSAFLKAQHYMEQAANMRKLADAEQDETARNQLLDMMKGYERLAAKFMQMGEDANKRGS